MFVFIVFLSDSFLSHLPKLPPSLSSFFLLHFELAQNIFLYSFNSNHNGGNTTIHQGISQPLILGADAPPSWQQQMLAHNAAYASAPSAATLGGTLRIGNGLEGGGGGGTLNR